MSSERKQKTDARSFTAAERKQKAFLLRKGGLTYQEIADELGISRQACHGLIRRELVRLNTQTEGDAHVMRELELERLDSLTTACWEKGMAGDPQMIDKLLKISKRRAELLGLDAPLKTSIDLIGSNVHVYLPDNGRDPVKGPG